MEREMQKYVEIGETKYMVSVLPPTRSLKLLTRLSKIIGGPMSELAKGEDEDRRQMIPVAVKALLANLDEDRTVSVIKEILSCVSVDGKMVNMERQFHGKLGELIKVCKEALEVNYADFLDEISALMD